jgi:hypothetical protein
VCALKTVYTAIGSHITELAKATLERLLAAGCFIYTLELTTLDAVRGLTAFGCITNKIINTVGIRFAGLGDANPNRTTC